MLDQTELDRHRGHQDRHFEVSVIYNGVAKAFRVSHDETVKTLLDQALNIFGPINNAHTLALYTKDGIELKDEMTLKSACIEPHDKLLLRPSAVKGG